MTIKNIGLALSGGGYRAAVFHMGVLARLAEDNLLEEVTAISTVSGGSLGTGLIFALNGLRWPTSAQYRETIVSEARQRLTTQDLKSDLISRFIYACLTLNLTALLTRAADFSQLLQKRWNVIGPLSQLPDRPRWFINATCYESGKDWRFEKNCAGDYRFGYTRETDAILLSDALAASSGFPGLVGALPFNMTNHTWQDRCDDSPGQRDVPRRASKDRLSAGIFPMVHLWDGGIYDNNGLEVFHNFDSPRWQSGVEFLIVSDVSGKVGAESYRIGLRALFRLITGVMMEQIRSLRARAVVTLMREPNTQAPGAYLRIGNTCQDVLTKAKVSAEVVARLNAECLSPEVVAQTEELEIEIRRLKPDEFKTLFRHGFEVADYTLYAHHPDQFKYIGFSRSRWPSLMG